MVGLLAEAGYGYTDENDAAVVVVNTCSFIQDAREESVRTLVGLAEQGKELIIAGCLAQHFQRNCWNRSRKPGRSSAPVTTSTSWMCCNE